MASPLHNLARAFRDGRPVGITSVCTAHPMVIEAALRQGLERDGAVLIEATCNQVNQDGGYTGMTPAGFRRFVEAIAGKVGFPVERLILGGDHLGPNPWRKLPAEAAMAKAEVLVADYAAAGFSKIHLDASMACGDDPSVLLPADIAARATRLARIAEDAAGAARPVYIVGTEVPVPGGAHEVLDELAVTRPADAAETIDLHRTMFAKAGLEGAFERVVGLVVQPGVEFGHQNVIHYRPEKSQALTDWLRGRQGLVFEAHSTDYQTGAALGALVANGFAILKVGPGLTFALREAFYALDGVAAELDRRYRRGALPEAMEGVMQRQPDNWAAYYHGTPEEQRLLRHFSYSDRIRYYWTDPAAVAAVDGLFAALAGRDIPETLVSQYLPTLYPAVASGRLAPRADALALANVGLVLETYAQACGQ